MGKLDKVNHINLIRIFLGSPAVNFLQIEELLDTIMPRNFA